MCRDEANVQPVQLNMSDCGLLQVVTTVIVSLVVEAFTFRLALGNEEAKRKRICKRDHDKSCKCYQGKKKSYFLRVIHFRLLIGELVSNIQHKALYTWLQ